uniref:Uncharacterized protein n=1 Tax=Chromera velia CCMP2878 TaxID=1169474 RepID=A0A0G4GC78_9ALVE|eukprot:Cvel_21255.t1-p1 / transcript=Cvel_21255.t1 / gene=Cvel_21255 / organism=Chromera_velia_CCMP2878 / gene_product=hypothetical protein / transcript_product=hypothetical protein / location=Cvel_scaffold1977:17311-19957(+) / protein_length=374 / sequence_SO=supercontig / SO=protein_coding / is_pseudo=false
MERARMRNCFDTRVIEGKKTLPAEMPSESSSGHLIRGAAGRTVASRGRLAPLMNDLLENGGKNQEGEDVTPGEEGHRSDGVVFIDTDGQQRAQREGLDPDGEPVSKEQAEHSTAMFGLNRKTSAQTLARKNMDLASSIHNEQNAHGVWQDDPEFTAQADAANHFQTTSATYGAAVVNSLLDERRPYRWKAPSPSLAVSMPFVRAGPNHGPPSVALSRSLLHARRQNPITRRIQQPQSLADEMAVPTAFGGMLGSSQSRPVSRAGGRGQGEGMPSRAPSVTGLASAAPPVLRHGRSRVSFSEPGVIRPQSLPTLFSPGCAHSALVHYRQEPSAAQSLVQRLPFRRPHDVGVAAWNLTAADRLTTNVQHGLPTFGR